MESLSPHSPDTMLNRIVCVAWGWVWILSTLARGPDEVNIGLGEGGLRKNSFEKAFEYLGHQQYSLKGPASHSTAHRRTDVRALTWATTLLGQAPDLSKRLLKRTLLLSGGQAQVTPCMGGGEQDTQRNPPGILRTSDVTQYVGLPTP